MREHIAQMKLAVEVDGVELMGYTPWGIIDIVSFGTGEMEKLNPEERFERNALFCAKSELLFEG